MAHSNATSGNAKTAAPSSTCVGRNNRGVTSGYARTIGRRPQMEDTLTIYPRLFTVSCAAFGGCRDSAPHKSSVHYFAVFDGHGGNQVSRYCAEQLHTAVKQEWERGGEAEWIEKWECALTRAYRTVDNTVCDDIIIPPSVGSTALAALISPCQIVVANCGDSRAVLCRGARAIPLTADHKLSRKDEAVRVCDAGGRILFVGCLRVDGVLSMTRAIGDKNLKPMIVAVPEVTFTARSDDDECLILASDGVWDVMSDEEAATLARRTLRHQRKLASINDTLCRPAQCAADAILEKARLAGSSDNISVIVVDLKLLKKKRLVLDTISSP